MSFIIQLLDRFKKLPKPVKASICFTGCYVIQRGLQFISMPIYTRIMSTSEYGVYSVFLSWFNLVSVFSSLSIYNGTFNKAMIKYADQRDNYISSIQWLTTIVTTIICFIILLYSEQIGQWTGFSFQILLLLCVHLLMFPSLQYWSQKQRFLFEYKKLILVTLLNSGASLLLGIAMVLLSNNKSLALIIATVLIQAIINICIFFSLAQKGKCVYNANYWKWTLITALPLIPHYLSEILLGHADRLMINQMCGTAEAGIYNIVYQLSMVMTIVRTGINGAFTPWLYYSLKKEDFLNIKITTKYITGLMWLMTLLFMLCGPELLRIVAPSSYYEAVIDIPAVMIGCFFIYVYVLFLNVEIYYEQNQFVAIASIIAAVVNVVLNYLCIPLFGYLAAGYTTMISYMIMACLHYIFLRRILFQKTNLKQVFDFRFLFSASILLLMCGVMSLMLYHYMIIRYAVIIFLFVLLLIKRNIIFQLLKNFQSRN